MRLSHPLLAAAQIFGVHTSASCTVFNPVLFLDLLGVLTLVPVILLVGAAALTISPWLEHAGNGLWRWAATFTAVWMVPAGIYIALALVDDEYFSIVTAGNVFFLIGLSAPLWSFAFGRLDTKSKSPPWFSAEQRIATATIAVLALLSAAWVESKKTAPTRNDRSAPLSCVDVSRH